MPTQYHPSPKGGGPTDSLSGTLEFDKHAPERNEARCLTTRLPNGKRNDGERVPAPLDLLAINGSDFVGWVAEGAAAESTQYSMADAGIDQGVELGGDLLPGDCRIETGSITQILRRGSELVEGKTSSSSSQR